jgi:F1F0 ATPase subunit 2
MSDTANLAAALIAGAMIGCVFFGGLWWTVHRLMSANHAGVWLAGSFLLRMAMAVGGFYFVSQGAWHRLLACLLGFIIARMCWTRFTRRPLDAKPLFVRGAGP